MRSTYNFDKNGREILCCDFVKISFNKYDKPKYIGIIEFNKETASFVARGVGVIVYPEDREVLTMEPQEEIVKYNNEWVKQRFWNFGEGIFFEVIQ